MFTLNDSHKAWLVKIHAAEVSDKERQEMYSDLYGAIYATKAYGVKETQYFTITTNPVELFGRCAIDTKSIRKIEAPKLSKSNLG